MGPYLMRRLGTTLIVMIGISFAVFLIVHLIPGDPAHIMLGMNANQRQVEALRKQLGIDRSLLTQYGYWVWNGMQGKLGSSILTGQPVSGALAERLPVTLSLAGAALLIALLISLPAGILAAVKRNTWPSYAITIASQIGVATPDFWLGILFILVFSLWLGLLPSFGYVSPSRGVALWLAHLILPAMSLGLINASLITRFVRSAMIEVLGEDYISVARAKGLSERVVVVRHALRNVLIPVVTVVGLQLGSLISGVVVIEVVFALPGLGRLAFDAVTRRDYPMLQGAVLVVALAFALVNLLVDFLYAYIDPRVRY